LLQTYDKLNFAHNSGEVVLSTVEIFKKWFLMILLTCENDFYSLVPTLRVGTSIFLINP